MSFTRPLRSELQARLDTAKVLEKLQTLQEIPADADPCAPPLPEFRMSGLFGLIPGSDTSPIRIDGASRENRCQQ
jgi:hypothetical protein